ncbi:MAG TPA: hypothetical protein PKC22_13220, partial [Rhodocyclaceae bacterium]|nr:hypothetical protein [Rhodocyclaceae bacterium]
MTAQHPPSSSLIDGDELAQRMRTLGAAARAASTELARASTRAKNRALMAIAASLRARGDELLTENARDLDAARSAGLEEPMIDRLRLSEKSIEAMADGLEQVAALPDPVGEISDC